MLVLGFGETVALHLQATNQVVGCGCTHRMHMILISRVCISTKSANPLSRIHAEGSTGVSMTGFGLPNPMVQLMVEPIFDGTRER